MKYLKFALIISMFSLVNSDAQKNIATKIDEALTGKDQFDLCTSLVTEKDLEGIVSVFQSSGFGNVAAKLVFASSSEEMKQQFAEQVLQIAGGSWGNSGATSLTAMAYIGPAEEFLNYLDLALPDKQFVVDDFSNPSKRLKVLERLRSQSKVKNNEPFSLKNRKLEAIEKHEESLPKAIDLDRPLNGLSIIESPSQSQEPKSSASSKWPYIVVGIALLTILVILLRAAKRKRSNGGESKSPRHRSGRD